MSPELTGPAMKAQRGLTLVEVVIATAVLAVLLLGVFSAMAHAIRVDALAREREVAAREALQMIDDRVMVVSTDTAFDALVALPDDDPSLYFHVRHARDGQTFNLPAASTSPIAGPGGEVGKLEISADLNGDGAVSASDPGYYDDKPHLIAIRATVRWRDADGLDQEVNLTSMKVRP